jgi:hypothetical protein
VGASGNQYTLMAIATTASHHLPAAKGSWTLQHRHPDGKHWLVIGHFATRALARETAKAFVTAGYGPAEDFRVRRSKDPEDFD